MTLLETAPIVVQTPEAAEFWREEEDRNCENRIVLLRSITVREAEESNGSRRIMLGCGRNIPLYLYTVKGNQ